MVWKVRTRSEQCCWEWDRGERPQGGRGRGSATVSDGRGSLLAKMALQVAQRVGAPVLAVSVHRPACEDQQAQNGRQMLTVLAGSAVCAEWGETLHPW